MEGRGETIQGVDAPERTVKEEIIEITETVEEAPSNDSAKEESKPESVRETAERAYRELQKETKQDAGNKDTTKQASAEAKTPDAKKPNALESQENPDDLLPPNRLSIKEKEVFNQLPKELKPAFARMVREHEAKFTKTQQEAARLIDENRSLYDAIRPFAEDIASRNLTIPQAVAGLLATHKKLTNPDTALQKWIEIGADIGVSQEQLAPFLQGVSESVKTPAAPSQDVLALRQELESLKSKLKQQDDDAFQRSVAPIIAEGQSVANETDSSGRYVWPELHDEELVRTRVKPLVSALVEALPDLSYGDALKRAVTIVRGQSNGNFQQVNQTRLPAQTSTQRAQAAAVSVRGRSAPAVSGSTMPDKIPDSARDTVRLALEQLRRGA